MLWVCSAIHAEFRVLSTWNSELILFPQSSPIDVTVRPADRRRFGFTAIVRTIFCFQQLSTLTQVRQLNTLSANVRLTLYTYIRCYPRLLITSAWKVNVLKLTRSDDSYLQTCCYRQMALGWIRSGVGTTNGFVQRIVTTEFTAFGYFVSAFLGVCRRHFPFTVRSINKIEDIVVSQHTIHTSFERQHSGTLDGTQSRLLVFWEHKA